jgi:hypothetical protein
MHGTQMHDSVHMAISTENDIIRNTLQRREGPRRRQAGWLPRAPIPRDPTLDMYTVCIRPVNWQHPAAKRYPLAQGPRPKVVGVCVNGTPSARTSGARTRPDAPQKIATAYRKQRQHACARPHPRPISSTPPSRHRDTISGVLPMQAPLLRPLS